MKITRSLFVSAFVIALVAGNSWAANKTSEIWFKKAVAVFERSLAGDESVTGVALNQFKMLSMTYPDNPLFLAYKGACKTLMGRDAWMPWNKSYYTEDGLEQISQALRMLKPKHDQQMVLGAPISVETRLIAVSTFSEVPESFNHFEKAKAVLKELLQSPALKASPPELQAKVHQRAANIAYKENQRHQ